MRARLIGSSNYPEDIPSNELKSMRLSQGLSQAALGSRTGLSASQVSMLELGISGPLHQNGKITQSAARLMKYFQVGLGDIFPRDVCRLPSSGELLDCQHEGVSRATSSDSPARAEARLLLARLARGLKPILREVLRLRYLEDMSLEECGQEMGGRSRERIRQMEYKALAHLRKWALILEKERPGDQGA